MSRWAGWIALVVVMAAGALFALGNAGRVVSLNLGLFTLSRVPVTFVAFGGMVVGMGVVLAAGVHADLKVRRLLRERGERDEPGPGERPALRFRGEHEQGDMRLE